MFNSHGFRWIGAALALAVLTGAGAEHRPRLPDQQYSSIQASRDDLVIVARAIEAGNADIDAVWPGFWPAGQSFLLLSFSGGELLVSHRQPSGFQPLKEQGRSGRGFFVRDTKPGGQSFPGEGKIEGVHAYMLPALGRSNYSRVSFYLHEAFHYYQRKASVAPRTTQSSVCPQ
jgi:hypothetical protein